MKLKNILERLIMNTMFTAQSIILLSQQVVTNNLCGNPCWIHLYHEWIQTAVQSVTSKEVLIRLLIIHFFLPLEKNQDMIFWSHE